MRPISEQPLLAWRGYLRLALDWRRYLAIGGEARLADFYPCLSDRTETTGIDPQYFHQAVWGLRRIREAAPARHVDVGSDVRWVGSLTCITEVEFVDIRPLRVNLAGLTCRTGSILALPYESGSLESISALHVIEHVGLGRYGDPLDPDGTIRACAELARVLAPGGRLYLSAPIGRPRVQFNGQRVLAIGQLLGWLEGLTLVEMALVDNAGQFHASVSPEEVRFDEDADLDYALGCFVFVKPATPFVPGDGAGMPAGGSAGGDRTGGSRA